MATKAAAVKKETGLSTMQAEMAKKLAEMNETTTTSENTQLKINATTIEVPNMGEADAPMDVVLVSFITRREFYDKPWDKDNPQPPACFAHGSGDSAGFKPVAQSPNAESTACKGCPNNEWETANVGRGKACGEVRYVAVMLPNASKPDDPIYTIRVPSSKLKAFDGYIKKISHRTGQLPLFVVSTITPASAGSIFSVTFDSKAANPNPEYFWGRMSDAQNLLMQLPDFSSYEVPKAKRRR